MVIKIKQDSRVFNQKVLKVEFTKIPEKFTSKKRQKWEHRKLFKSKFLSFFKINHGFWVNLEGNLRILLRKKQNFFIEIKIFHYNIFRNISKERPKSIMIKDKLFDQKCNHLELQCCYFCKASWVNTIPFWFKEEFHPICKKCYRKR